MPFKRLLIANRGEIAIRIVRIPRHIVQRIRHRREVVCSVVCIARWIPVSVGNLKEVSYRIEAELRCAAQGIGDFH